MNKFSRFMKKQGYYILLVLCVLLVATVITLSVVMSQRLNNDVPTANVPQDPNDPDDGANGDGNQPEPMKFLAPVNAEVGRVNDEFYDGALHRGVDYQVEAGTKVTASYTGTVERIGYDGKLGNSLVVKYDNGYTATYCGIDVNAALDNGVKLAAGSQVAQGQHIATVAASGYVCSSDLEEPHLHFQLQKTDTIATDVNASYVDPTTIFGSENK